MKEPHLLYETNGHIPKIIINRPEAKNALGQIDGATEGVASCIGQGFAERGVGEGDSGQLLEGRFHLNGEDSCPHHFIDPLSDQMNPQNFPVLSVRHDLHQPLRLAQNHPFWIHGKGRSPFNHSKTFLFGFLAGEPHAGDLRPRIGHPNRRAGIEACRSPQGILCRDDATG